MAEESHSFDRRVEDVNVAALGTRIRGIEETVHEKMVPDLEHNTRICTKLHDAVFGKGDEDGLAMKVQEIHDVLIAGKNVVRILVGFGNGVFWVIERGGRIAKPLFWLLVLAGSIVTYVKTGVWDAKP